jgi:hypothetical protein
MFTMIKETNNLVPYTAKNTLDFIRSKFVKTNANTTHIAWTKILLHTRDIGHAIYQWQASFDPLIRAFEQARTKKMRKMHITTVKQLKQKDAQNAYTPQSKQLLLLGMSAIKLSGIDINHHIDESFEGKCSPLKFKEELKSTGKTHSRAETYYYKVIKGDATPCDIYRNTTLYDECNNIVLMTEIQLKNVVNRLGKESVTGTDGDEFTIKDGV